MAKSTVTTIDKCLGPMTIDIAADELDGGERPS
jgi:hypothetical protein